MYYHVGEFEKGKDLFRFFSTISSEFDALSVEQSSMILNVLDQKTRDVMTSSYALPDLETAVQQVIYNAIDAHAKTIKLSVDVVNASFTVVDDGDGIQPDDLYKYTGECFASSRLPISKSEVIEHKQQKTYGSRGAFLYELVSLATSVEIESRVHEHWTSYRKVFQEGEVVFNARSKQLQKDAGTKLSASNLFGKHPVRRKDLSRNMKHRTRVIQNIRNFCVSMSMIWPSLSIDIRFQDEEVRPVIIPAAKTCRERFLAHFGQVLGNELQYVEFSSETTPFSIRGYFAFIPSGIEGLGQGVKQAKRYYQFAFLDNEWVDECHQICSRTITEAALEYSSSIPIFVLKVEAPSGQYDASGIGRKEHIVFKTPDHFHQFLFEFVQKLADIETNQVEIQRLNKHQARSSDQADNSPFIHSSLLSTPFFFDLPDHESDEESAFPVQTHDFGEMKYWDQDSPVYDEDQLLEFDIRSRWHYDDEERNIVEGRDKSEWSLSNIFLEDLHACHACGHIANSRGTIDEATEIEDSNLDIYTKANCLDTLTMPDEYPVADFASLNNDERDNSKAEKDLEDVFFNEPCKSLVISEEIGDTAQNSVIRLPWLSSKPDTYDVADAMLDLCDGKNCNNDDRQVNVNRSRHDERLTANSLKQSVAILDSRYFNYPRPPLHSSSAVGTKSDYFAVRTMIDQQPNSFLKRWLKSKVPPVKHLAAALQVDNVRVLQGNRVIKISKSMLTKLQVIRQVDRKFILVQADTSRGKLLLCLDQHAADERVRLEKLEEEMFGRDGSLRQIEIHNHEPPVRLRMNFKECSLLQLYEDVIRSWGFDFECSVSKPETIFCMNTAPEFQENDDVFLHATPKVDKRVANVDDFRDFIQLLSRTGKIYPHSQLRPPVITRLLHSRACRSAIMFGDRLSIGQCKDLIDELKTCQLPFQCAHGRPSVVPLAEISDDPMDN